MAFKTIAAIVLLGLLSVGISADDSLDKTREIITETNQTLKKSQQTIDKTDDKTSQMFEEYKSRQKEIDNYNIYNSQLKEIINSQKQEKQVFLQDIENIESTGLRIMPFMRKMINGLEQFITSDYPFLPEERSRRIAGLKENMKRADLSIAAKYRQILEAYQVENDYGNTIEAYEGDIDNKKVVFLKIGRIGFYYLSLDKQYCSAWVPEKKQWQELEDADYRISIARAIKIAKKQQTPDLFFAAVPPARSKK